MRAARHDGVSPFLPACFDVGSLVFLTNVYFFPAHLSLAFQVLSAQDYCASLHIKCCLAPTHASSMGVFSPFIVTEKAIQVSEELR
jgi:hypothetical protein